MRVAVTRRRAYRSARGRLAFATHDLCHLEKFVDPAHHEGQKGFFRTLDRAMRLPGWAPFMARFDDELVREIFHVAADMNGAAIFLFAALKMKVKMASRRRVSAKRGSPLVTTGPLDPVEARAYEDEEGQLLDLLDLRGEARDAARAVKADYEKRTGASATILVPELSAGSRAAAGG